MLPSSERSRQLGTFAIAEGTNDDTPAQILQTALDGTSADMGRFIKAGQTVAIKPTRTWAYARHTASSTDPAFLAAVIKAAQKADASRIIVMDHCSIKPGAEAALSISGIGHVVKELGVEHVFADRFNAPLNPLGLNRPATRPRQYQHRRHEGRCGSQHPHQLGGRKSPQRD